MKNIIFSSTRQWNPGDEFILDGVRRLFGMVGLSYNPVLYNRHPDIRSQSAQPFKASKIPADFHLHEDTQCLEANLKLGFFDNSLKPDTDCQFADWAVFAGTPEWCNGRMVDLYAAILKNQLPVMILGVGGDFDLYDERFLPVIAQAKAFVVRDAVTLKAVEARGYSAKLLPCPALLSAPITMRRTVSSVRKLVLIYHTTVRESVIWNGFSEEAYAFMLKLYAELIRMYRDQYEISFVCHYIDELPVAFRDFPGFPVEYSYDARDYYDIYAKADFVIGPRVHGIGVSASLGIPGVALSHNSRGATCAGFLAPQVPMEGDIQTALHVIRKSISLAANRSAELATHCEKATQSYVEIISAALANAEVSYPNSESIRNYEAFDLVTLSPIAQEIRKIGSAD